MDTREYVLDEPNVAWKAEGKAGYVMKRLSNDKHGPDAHVGLAKEAQQSTAHFHDVAQFQVALQGSITISNRSIEAIGVYYSDPYTPYGHLTMSPGHYRAVLRPGHAGHSLPRGQIQMSDREGRKLRNPHGREFFGLEKDASWEVAAGASAGIRRKALFGSHGMQSAPKAELWECPPGVTLQRDPAPFGEYDVLVKGSARSSESELTPYCMRYHAGHAPPSALICGPEGALWLILVFDAAAELRSPSGALVQPQS